MRTAILQSALVLFLIILLPVAAGQNRSNRPASLPQDRFKSGIGTMRAFGPVAMATRGSILKLRLDGDTVALAAVIDTNGLAITKASEIKEGKLTARLATGQKADVAVIAVDDDNDVALLKLNAPGLKAIEWVADDVAVGQWVVTPGIEATPEAVGIISVPPRKILHKRALIGVVLDFEAAMARIKEVMPGLGAAKANLSPGDVILAVNEKTVKKSEELTATLRNFREGESVKLRVQRAEEEFEVTVPMMIPKPERTWRGADRQDRMDRMGGELSRRAEGFALAIQHDTVLQPWQCGGPLVNLEGKAIGLNIARAGRVASYSLPAALVKEIIEQLKTRAEAAVKHEVRD